MPHSDAPDSPSFKIRDGLGVLGCLVIGAVIIVLGSRAGLFSLTPASSLLLGAAGQLVTIFAIVWLARRRGVRIHELIIGKNAWWREAVFGVLGAIVLWAIAIGLCKRPTNGTRRLRAAAGHFSVRCRNPARGFSCGKKKAASLPCMPTTICPSAWQLYENQQFLQIALISRARCAVGGS